MAIKRAKKKESESQVPENAPQTAENKGPKRVLDFRRSYPHTLGAKLLAESEDLFSYS